ncbi:ubiquitin thioesterase otulin-like [Megalops cyprinoides]|uniref:ubiquitin thioesterase otulin-like n=1 Tax=Megalops cyprinoides TaxID=118141 RepID=UPI0018640D6F|nr:ubiquitin thioesterase otulin-like [Megalops cyprinoides]
MGHDSESSSQAETHKPEDQLTARKSDTTEEEKVEDPVSRIVGLSEVPSLEDIMHEVEDKTVGDVAEEVEGWDTSKSSCKGEKVEHASNSETKVKTQEECTNWDSPLFVEVKVEPVKCEHDTFGEEQDDGNYDLYRGADEIAKERSEQKQLEPLIQITLPGVQDRSSVAPAMDVLSYSQREWKGNTAKSTLIKKGYAELSQSFGDVRRVRGDNYCALRATLFKVLSQSSKLPAWLQEDDTILLPEKLVTEEDLIEGWRFPLEHREEAKMGGAVEQLKHCLQLLQKRFRAAAEAGSEEKRQQLCEEVFQGGEEEYALLEALKFLMLSSATELHARMQRGDDVPIFCWLLFARDSSTCPRTFLANHLSHVGFSGGLEQVEMFLLGYTLQHTIQVYRLYMADTEEFITYYPDDHKEDWPHVCLVTEDDRHYNVPVGKPVGLNSQNLPQ